MNLESSKSNHPFKLKLPWTFRKRAAYEKLKQQRDDSEQSKLDLLRRYSTAWPQVCFLHLAKTAGSSINELLSRRFANSSGVRLTPEELDEKPVGALESLGLVSAHFSIRHLPVLASNRFLFTFLRDPVDRVISNYYHLRAYDGPLDRTNTALLSAKSKSFHDFLRDEDPQVRAITENMQAHALVWDWRGAYRRQDSHLGQKSIAALDHFDYVGLFEHYETSLQELFALLHWQLEPEEQTLVINKTPERPSVSEIDPRTRSLIEELNQVDQQLYDFVLARFRVEPFELAEDAQVSGRSSAVI